MDENYVSEISSNQIQFKRNLRILIRTDYKFAELFSIPGNNILFVF
jgi:hypothetical protein